MAFLISARAIQGLGSGGLFVLALSVERWGGRPSGRCFPAG